MPDRSPDLAVVVLAGGEATRLPGKLALDAGNVPLLVRVVRNVSPGRFTTLSCKGALPPALDALVDAPAVIDRWPLRGPLSGLLSTMSVLHAPFVCAVAGDAPFVDAAFIDGLEAQLRPGDEAVVPYLTVDGRRAIEPLAAIYAREPFLREGLAVLQSGEGALRLVIDRLNARFVEIADDRVFANVNTPAEYDAVRAVLA